MMTMMMLKRTNPTFGSHLHLSHHHYPPFFSSIQFNFSSKFQFFIKVISKIFFLDMDGTLGLLGGSPGGGGGGVPSGGSGTGSISTVSKEENLGCLSSEVSSSYPDESELELGLGLSIGGGGVLKSKTGSWGQYARILTAKDFPSSVSKANSSTSGTKRTASDPVSPPNGTSQVVGWPPIRAYRMNSLVNQAKSPADGFSSMVNENKSKNAVVDNNGNKNNNNTKDKVVSKTSLFVKVNMDGTLIGRKVDLNAHSCYETLAQTLENMFDGPTTTISARRTEKYEAMTQGTGPSKLLDGSSEFVLTYEDKDGDWMLVGDVPWRMFLSSVKRLRIMRTSEANGLAPRLQERSGRQRTKAAA